MQPEVQGYSATHSLRPHPQTPSYGVADARRPPLIEMPSSSVHCEGWGQANLQHKVDYSELSFADKYLQGPPRARTFWLRTDGWVLCFWDPALWDERAADRGHLFPVGWLDLRSVMAPQYRRAGMDSFQSTFQFEVIAHTKTGRFLFEVPTESDAAMWVHCMNAALVEGRTLEMKHHQAALAAAEMDDAYAGVGVVGKRHYVEAPMPRSNYSGSECSEPYIEVSAARAAVLKSIWVKCLRCAIHGQTPQVFQEMFRLYDDNSDYMLQVEELEVLLKELLWVRRETLRQAREEQMQDGRRAQHGLSKLDFDERAEVGKLAKELDAHYEFLRKDGYRSRALVLQSALDTSHDGYLTEGEFVRGAPELILPGRELWMEAKFYERAGAQLARRAKLRGEDCDSEDEGGCVQH